MRSIHKAVLIASLFALPLGTGVRFATAADDNKPATEKPATEKPAGEHQEEGQPGHEGQPASVLPNLNKLTDAEKADGWKLLFNGENTDGWRNYKKEDVSKGWQVIDGALCRVANRAGDLLTKEQYESFILELDYKVPPNANSGIMFRVSEDSPTPWMSGIEFQLLDNANPKGDPQKSGWAYQLYKPEEDPKTGKPLDATKPAGEWNHIKLVVDGNHVEHWMNGTKYFEYELGSDDFNERLAKSKFKRFPHFAKNKTGFIALQGDHGNVCFANIKIKPLPAKS
jgi:hypothetical protein